MTARFSTGPKNTLPTRRDGRKASVTMMIAMVMPAILLALVFVSDVAVWSVLKIKTYRAAIVAAEAGARSYNLSPDKRMAATVATTLAKANGISTNGASSWNASTNTMTTANIVTAVVSGAVASSNPALRVTVSSPAANAFAAFFTTSSYTVTATATAELIVFAISNGCVVATSKTGSGISLGGTVNLDASGCMVLSNTTQDYSGSVIATAATFLAYGAITVGSNASVTGALLQNAGLTVDPYAVDGGIISTFASISPGSTRAQGVQVQNGQSKTIDPGIYRDFRLTGGTLYLNPGLYIVDGDIVMHGGAAMIGTGVTIAFGGALSSAGGAYQQLSAGSTATVVNGALPAVVLMGNSTSSQNVGGNTNTRLTGVVYFPNAPLSFSGTSTANGSSGCLQLIAASVTLTGTPELAPSCASLGALSLSNTFYNAARSVH